VRVEPIDLLRPSFLFLRAVDRSTPAFLTPATVIGRVPLFFYVIHFSLIHVLAVVACFARYGSAHWMFESPDRAHYPVSTPPGWGYALPGVYATWAVVVVVMFPLCRWFEALKHRRRDVWLLSYM
jgi:hypothetical protein